MLALLLALSAPVVRPTVRLSPPAVHAAPTLKTTVPTLTTGLAAPTLKPGLTATPGVAPGAAPLAVVQALEGVTASLETGGAADTAQAGLALEQAITGELSIPTDSGVSMAPAGGEGGQGKGPVLRKHSRGPPNFKPPVKKAPQPPSKKKWRIPILTAALMLTNWLAYGAQVDLVSSGAFPSGEAVVEAFGFWPEAFRAAFAGSDPLAMGWEAVTSLTAMFMHGSEAHLNGNLVGLAVFGTAVEMMVRRGRMALVYFAAGIGGFLMLLTGLGGPIEGSWIGASGAIFGIGGAFAAMTPRILKENTPWRGMKLSLAALAAVMASNELITWLAKGSGVGGVAHSVHVFGFAIGAVLGAIFLRAKPQN